VYIKYLDIELKKLKATYVYLHKLLILFVVLYIVKTHSVLFLLLLKWQVLYPLWCISGILNKWIWISYYTVFICWLRSFLNSIYCKKSARTWMKREGWLLPGLLFVHIFPLWEMWCFISMPHRIFFVLFCCWLKIINEKLRLMIFYFCVGVMV
jgi:hypothetical protein